MQNGEIKHLYIEEKAESFSFSFYEKTQAILHFIKFISETSIEIKIPDKNALLELMYNGYKWKHAIKMWFISPPDEICADRLGPMKGILHDRKVYKGFEWITNWKHF